MSRAFWFWAGVGAAALAATKGREYYRRLTPAGMAEQLERRAGETADQARRWVDDFATTYQRARAAKRSELLGLLQHDERGQLE